MMAAVENDVAIVEALLKCNADTEIENHVSRNPSSIKCDPASL